MHQRSREVSIPAAAFDHLRGALADAVGESAGVAALHAAGFASGESLFEMFSRTDDGPPSALGTRAFWAKVARFFGERGWGRLDAESPHPGVAFLVSDDWAEADSSGDEHSTCAFTSGALSYLLTETAGAPVAVLETSCRARGDDRCEFAIGSERNIHTLYTRLVEGHPLSEALARI